MFVFLQCLALSSTAYNPIIYTFLNQKFRNSFKSLLQRRSGRVGPLAINRKELCNSDGTKMGIIKCAKSTAKTDITPAPMTRFTLYKSRCWFWLGYGQQISCTSHICASHSWLILFHYMLASLILFHYNLASFILFHYDSGSQLVPVMVYRKIKHTLLVIMCTQWHCW